MNHKRWTPEDINYLKENVGHRRISDIASKLNRTEEAIKIKLKRLGFGQTKSISGRVTCGELARILSIDRNTVMNWVNTGGLPSLQKVTGLKRRYILISSDEFWEWAENNREKIDFRRLERNSYPPEPDWVEAERQNPSHAVRRTYQSWTTQEDLRLAMLIDQGLSYQDISLILNRTPYSVQRRYYRIKRNQDYYKGSKNYAIKPGERKNNEQKKNDIQ